VETVTFPGAPFVLDDARAVAVEHALRLLHLIAGVSYYKAAAPPEIRIEGYVIDADTADLLQTIYLNGLGEFAYRNGLQLRERIRFPVGVEVASASMPSTTGSAESAPVLGLRQHALWRSAAARIRWSRSRRCVRSASTRPSPGSEIHS